MARARATVSTFKDAVVNFISGHGTSVDPSGQNRAARVHMDYDETLTLYRNYWLARKIINVPVQDMLKNGRDITNLDKDDLAKYAKAWKDMKTNKALKRALYWAALIGGAGIIPVADDMELDEPYDPSNFTDGKLKRFVVLDAHELQSNIEAGLITDITSRYFQLPQTLTYQGNQIDISNVIIAHGEDIPSTTHAQYDGMNIKPFWGLSKLAYSREPVVYAHALYEAILAMVQQNNVDILKVPGLYNTIADCANSLEMGESDKALTARAALFAKYKSQFNVAMVDIEETIERLKYDFGGLPQLIHEFVIAVSGASDIPLTRLAGISPGGLNSTGESDLKNYYNNIRSQQNDLLVPLLDEIDRYMTLACFGEEIELEYTVNPPHVLSEQEEADLADKETDTTVKIEGMNLVPESYLLRRMQRTTMPEITDDFIEEVELEEAGDNRLNNDPDPDPDDVDPGDDPEDDEDENQDPIE